MDPIIIESERSNEKSLHRVAVLVSIRDKFTLSQVFYLLRNKDQIGKITWVNVIE